MELFPEVLFWIDRIIDLEIDALVYKDSSIFNLSLNENHALRLLDFYYVRNRKLGTDLNKYINSRVMILNSKKIEKAKNQFKQLIIYLKMLFILN